MAKECHNCANCTDFNLINKGYKYAHCELNNSSISVLIEFKDRIPYECTPDTKEYWAPKPTTMFAKFLLLFNKTKQERWLDENFDI